MLYRYTCSNRCGAESWTNCVWRAVRMIRALPTWDQAIFRSAQVEDGDSYLGQLPPASTSKTAASRARCRHWHRRWRWPKLAQLRCRKPPQQPIVQAETGQHRQRQQSHQPLAQKRQGILAKNRARRTASPVGAAAQVDGNRAGKRFANHDESLFLWQTATPAPSVLDNRWPS